MTDFKAWIAPEGAVVAPPVHPETQVHVIYSDGELPNHYQVARKINWSTYGDGPHVVAYRVVEEYREPVKPRECWSYGAHIRDTEADAIQFRDDVAEAYPGRGYEKTAIIHWVEVLE